MRAYPGKFEVLRQNVTKEVEQAYLDVKSGWELIRASKKALEAARENLRLAWGRYQAGVGTIIEVHRRPGAIFRGRLNSYRPSMITGCLRPDWTRPSASRIRFPVLMFV